MVFRRRSGRAPGEPPGEEDAQFAQEALSHLDSLYGTALRLTRRTQDAEDLVQDTYLKAFRSAYQFERGINPQFNSFGDSLWWAFSTMATLGYSTGPVTFLGRIVAGVLMILGIACFGLITATATTFFLQRTEKVRDYSTAELMEAMRAIDSRLTGLEARLTDRPNL